VIVTESTKSELIPSGNRHKSSVDVVHLHNCKSVVVPVDHKTGAGTSKDLDNDADKQQGHTRWVLDQNVVVRSERPPKREQ
jgi:hypothetical protein